MQNKEELKAVVTAARQGDGQVWLRGYRNSEGQLADYRLKLQPANYYGILLDQSEQFVKETALQSDEEMAVTFMLAGTLPLVSGSAMRKVLAELHTGLAARKQSHSESGTKVATFVAWNDDPNLMVASADPTGDVTLRNIEVLETVVRELAPVKISKKRTIARAPTEEDVAQKAVHKVWPLAKYSAQYKLAAGKFEKLELA